MSDLTFKEGINILMEADNICNGRACCECPFEREGEPCLGSQMPTPSGLKCYEDTINNLKKLIHDFKEGTKC